MEADPATLRAGVLKDLIDRSPASPYPRFRKLREEDPVFWHPRAEAWLLTRYADVVPALKDRRLGNTYLHKLFELLEPDVRERAAPMQRSLGLWLLYRDPPDHTRVRALFAKAFTPRLIARMRPLLEETVDSLLDAAQARGELELIGDLASPLPVMTMAGLLGARREEQERFKHWSDELAVLLGRHRAGREQVEHAQAPWAEVTEFFRGLVADRRAQPREDLISTMVAAEDQGSRFSEDEILASCGALLYAGSETTTHLIGNGVLALLAHPDQRARLAADPSLIGPAIEEFLRYDAPTQAAARIALEDLELGGKRIQKGQGVIALLGAANRDPERFPEPDALDLGREDNAHVAFSLGPHYCLGASLARLEGEVAIGALLRRFPRLRCEDPRLEWLFNPTIRGVTRLPLAL